MGGHGSERNGGFGGSGLLDAAPNTALERVLKLLARSFSAPMAGIGLVDADRVWLAARVGLAVQEVAPSGCPCVEVVRTGRALVVPALLMDERFCSGAYASHGAVAYAGAPLTGRDGHVLGSVFVLLSDLRDIQAAELSLLADHAAVAAGLMELQHGILRVDKLSGLPNRCRFIDDVDGLLREGGGERVLALLDLARPEAVSMMTRAVGSARVDELLRRDAAALQATLCDTAEGLRLYHVAPTQFAVLGPADAVPRGAEGAWACRLHEGLDGAAGSEGRGVGFLGVQYAAGVVRVQPGAMRAGETEAGETGAGGRGAVELLRRAHAALDDARAHRAPVRVYTPERDRAFSRSFTLLNDFGAALRGGPGEGGLRLVYQPRIDLRTDRCEAVEALLRWTHPRLGEIGPAEFVPLVEGTTMARGMLRWVLEQSLRQLAAWRSAGRRLQLSVNVSPVNLEEEDLVQAVLAVLGRHDVPAGLLELEVTESVLLSQGPAAERLMALSKAGIRIAIDDFGTGYSSLSYLQRLPADVVKIDRSFVRALGERDGLHVDAKAGHGETLVSAIIRMSQALGYRVVAEGVETEAAASALRSMGCDEVQGYLYGRPMAVPSLAMWLANRRWGMTRPRVRVSSRTPLPEFPAVRRETGALPVG